MNRSKLSSKVLIVLLVFSLVTSPFQIIVSASTENNKPTETDTNEKTDYNTENQADEVIEEISTEEVSEEDADPVEVEVTDEEVAPSNIEENVEEESLAPEDQVEGNKASEEENDIDEDKVNKTGVKKTTNNEDMMDDFSYYDDYHISIEDIYSNGNSITVTWSTSYDIGQDFDLSINGVHYATVPSNSNTYTFTDLKAQPDYEIQISTSIEKDDNVYKFHQVEWFTPDWAEEEIVPVHFIKTGDNLTTNEHLRIRGIDEGNKLFYEDYNLSYHNSEFYLPIGELELTIYDINDPSIATIETIEVKEGIDYLNNPIQLNINLSEIIDEAEPFHYELTGVTEDSITLKWDHVSKISGFKIVAHERDNYFNGIFHSESSFIPNNTNGYTFTGLAPDKVYSMDLIAIYKNNLELEDSFLVKTNGEDSKDKAVNFGDEKLQKEIANMLGIHFRDVTEADLERHSYILFIHPRY